MLAFEWKALRAGDSVPVHDDSTADLGLRKGVVSIVQTRPSPLANDISVRVDPGGTIVRPRRQAVHLIPIDPGGDCWRCDAAAALVGAGRAETPS